MKFQAKQVFKNLLITTITIFIITSCSIQEEVLFKKDFSGRYKYELDFSEMMNMTKAFGGDSTENQTLPLDEFNNPEQAKVLANALGLKKANITMTEESVLKIDFEFENLEELNRAYSRLDSSMPQVMEGKGMDEMENVPTYEYFKRKGKKLIFTKPIKNMGENEEIPIDMEEMQGVLEQMEDVLKSEMTITFEDRNIKKIQPTNINVEQNENTIKIITDLNKNLKESENKKQETPQVVIKLK